MESLHKKIAEVEEQLKELGKDPLTIITSNPYARPFEIYQPLVTSLLVLLNVSKIKEVSIFPGLYENMANNAKYSHVVSALRESDIKIVKE